MARGPGDRSVVFDSRFIRLLTALVVATWSPGQWCSCDGHAAGPDLQVQVSGASCCAENDSATPARAGCCGGCAGEQSHDEGPCGCLHGPTDAPARTAAALGTDGRLAVDSFDTLTARSPELTVPIVIGRGVSPCRGSPHAPPARSLLSLHCLLTT